ncbi:hypothetical protein PTKIN_Ptkin16aG0500200 [Pterospermum kingtungense]
MLCWISKAINDQIDVEKETIERSIPNQQDRVLNLNSDRHAFPGSHWSLFMAVEKERGKDWFGTAALLRDQEGFTVTLTRSMNVGNKLQAKQLLLREILSRGRDFNTRYILCFDYSRQWINILCRKMKVHCISPIHHDVNKMLEELEEIRVSYQGHPLLQQCKGMATKAAECRISFSYP